MCAKTVIKGALLGGIVLFVWGMVSWMVLPFHMQGIHQLEQPEAALGALMEQTGGQQGVYVAPCPEKQPDLIKTVPHTFIAIGKTSPNGFNMGPMMAIEFATNVVLAGLLTCVLMGLGAANLKQSLHYGLKIGALVAIAAVVPQWNWWQFSVPFLWPVALDYVVGITLAAIVIGRFAVKPNTTTA